MVNKQVYLSPQLAKDRADIVKEIPATVVLDKLLTHDLGMGRASTGN